MRERNGWTDDGTVIGTKQRCPNCNSMNYYQTLSTEKCDSCGLYCDYWGEGTNDVYERMMERKWAAEKARLEEEDDWNY